MLQGIQGLFRNRFQRWLDNRIPSTHSITLDQHRIFIFPSRAGLYFLAMMLVILLVAINYENNMVFALVFLLFSAFVVGILHTYVNLSGLSFTALRAHPCFVGDSVRFDIKVTRMHQRNYFDVALSWPQSNTQHLSLTDSPEATVSLLLPAHKRGRLVPPRLLVETVYPLGLLRAWTWLALDFEAIVYPRPVPGDLRSAGGGSAEEGEAEVPPGTADFYAFKAYQPGDPLRHIAWKKFARGQALQTKQFADYQDRQFWLDWEQFSGDQELRLSVICYWILKLELQGENYGLRIPGCLESPNHGDAHRERLLTALALFGAPSSSRG